MSKFENKKSMVRFWVVAFFFALVALAIAVKSAYTMTVKKSYWQQVNAKKEQDSIKVDAVRGSILSSNGQQLACNLPEYRIFWDFVALQEGKADTLWHDSLGHETAVVGEICQGLHEIFPEKSAEEFREHLRKGYEGRKRYWPIVRRRIDYTTFQKVKKLPILCLRRGISGLAVEEYMVRNRPYGSLASSIVGSTYKEKENGRAYAGLELAYDSILSGTPGYKHRRKVLSDWVDMVDSAAIDGRDIVTTIDVGIQDLAERSLLDEMREVGAYTGVAIVMDVKTGDIKAMVNMDRDPETGQFAEGRNHAIADVNEPGSVFKTASFMVALDDGVVDTSYVVDTGSGIMEMHGAKMRDHNWHKGGYGAINVSRALQVSSNIGVSYVIDKYYKQQPEKFVEGLHRVGIGEDLDLPFPEYHAPRIRMPKRNKSGKQWVNWSATALPWMSIGYETGVPPISVVTFYNGIANGGKMLRPRFVTEVQKDGEVLQEFPVEVLREKMCSDATLGKIQTMLRKVVSQGTGKSINKTKFEISGKTGTAQKGYGRRNGGPMHYLLSFVGYFPSDKPRYTCIVCLQKAGLPATGGMSALVFKNIAEGIMAKDIKYDVKSSRDSLSVATPDVKKGNVLAADFVLNQLGVKSSGGWNGQYATGKPVWGRVDKSKDGTSIQRVHNSPKNTMPDVIGMGARDAVYIIESRGAKVTISGRGKVKHQSKLPGATLKKGERIVLELA